MFRRLSRCLLAQCQYRYFCSARHTASALHPFITHLERAAGFAREDTPEAKLDKLAALLAPAPPPPRMGRSSPSKSLPDDLVAPQGGEDTAEYAGVRP